MGRVGVNRDKGAIGLQPAAVVQRSLVGGFLFNVAYLLYAVLVPLDAARQGLPPWEIGALAAAPGMVQLPLRVLSGPIVNVWGEPKMLRATFTSIALAGVVAVTVPDPVLGLGLGQLAVGLARGLYWTAAQALVGRQPGDRARMMGLFTTFTKGGALVGIFSAGFAADLLGAHQAFWIPSISGIVALILAWPIPTQVPANQAADFRRAVAGLWLAWRRPVVLLYGMTAFLCAMPQAMAQSFYPVYLLRLHAGQSLASALTALMSLGMVGAGYVGGRLMPRLGPRGLVAASATTMVLGFLVTSIPSLLVASVGIFLAGWAAGWLNVVFLTRIAELSTPRDRGTNLAMTQVYFAMAMGVTPLMAGGLLTWHGYFAVYALEAAIAVVFSVVHLLLIPKQEALPTAEARW